MLLALLNASPLEILKRGLDSLGRFAAAGLLTVEWITALLLAVFCALALIVNTILSLATFFEQLFFYLQIVFYRYFYCCYYLL